MISIVKLTDTDRPAWEKLFSGYTEFYGYTLPTPMVDRAWQAFQDDSRLHALGAKVDGQLAGIAHFLTHASTTSFDVCYLQDLFTDPAFRGRGVARALIAEVHAWAQSRECSRVYWTTHESNETARGLYDKVGEHEGFVQYVIRL